MALLALLYHQGGTTLASYAWTYTDSGEPVLLEGTSNTDWTPNGGLPSEFAEQGMLPVHDTDGVVDAIASSPARVWTARSPIPTTPPGS